MSRKICPKFNPDSEGICLVAEIGSRAGGCIGSRSLNRNIEFNTDSQYFCPHSDLFISRGKPIIKNRDKWIEYWESKKSGIPMKEDLPKDLIDKLDKAFEEWEKNKEK